MKEAVHQLKENYDKQAIALTELTRLVIAMNLTYEQLVSKMGESDETSDRLGEFASQQQSANYACTNHEVSTFVGKYNGDYY
ncbi:hypothetical protein CUMW_183770 [Citrus unshiu]|uniref:Uncharacterized protein n=1 Tax=Citrus unshiu TaxID=55188 RepID=A0A2H5Q038_CITUN|nr:hypothetical protein CUMW_183770 [Citrus unshiu]